MRYPMATQCIVIYLTEDLVPQGSEVLDITGGLDREEMYVDAHRFEGLTAHWRRVLNRLIDERFKQLRLM